MSPAEETLEKVREAMRVHGGCGDNSCWLVSPRGMATNGGCRCADAAGDYEKEKRLGRLLSALGQAVGRVSRGGEK